MRDERCNTCRFWLADDEDNGECRRLPPVLTVTILAESMHKEMPEGEFWKRLGSCKSVGFYDRLQNTNFPITERGDWCGEWKPLDNPQDSSVGS